MKEPVDFQEDAHKAQNKGMMADENRTAKFLLLSGWIPACSLL